MFKLILGDKVKKVVFLIAYFCLSLLCINYKETESVMTVSFEQTNLYNQNVYILTFKSFNSNNITQYFNKEEIKARLRELRQEYFNFLNATL